MKTGKAGLTYLCGILAERYPREMGLASGITVPEPNTWHEIVKAMGPVMNTALADCGLRPDVAPVYPKMAALVSEAVEMGRSVLARKRGTQKGGETCGAATLSKR